MKVSDVKYLKDYMISITFNDGVIGTIDLSDLVKQGIFSVLKDKAQFSKIYTTGYSLAWSEELEIDVAEIYSEISGKNPLLSQEELQSQVRQALYSLQDTEQEIINLLIDNPDQGLENASETAQQFFKKVQALVSSANWIEVEHKINLWT